MLFIIIIIIIIIIISFMQGIYIYIPETNYVPREYGVAAILLFLFMVLISLVSVLNLLYFYISSFWSMCAVPNMAVFCSSLTAWFSGMLLTYFLNVFEIVPVALIITGITFVFYIPHALYFVFIIIIIIIIVLGVGVAQSVKLLRHELEKLFLSEAKVLFSPQEPSNGSGDKPVYLFTWVSGDFSQRVKRPERETHH